MGTAATPAPEVKTHLRCACSNCKKSWKKIPGTGMNEHSAEFAQDCECTTELCEVCGKCTNCTYPTHTCS